MDTPAARLLPSPFWCFYADSPRRNGSSHFGDFYNSPVFNQALINNIAAIPGVDHPFVGQAGKVTFTGDSQSLGSGANDSVVFFADPTGTFPDTSQIIYIVNQADSGTPTITSGISVVTA